MSVSSIHRDPSTSSISEPPSPSATATTAPRPDVFEQVRRAASTPITGGDMVASLEDLSKHGINGLLLGGPPLMRRATRHWVGGNYGRAAAYVAPGAVLCAAGFVGDMATWTVGLVSVGSRKNARTPDGVWADRLVAAVNAHVLSRGQTPSAAGLEEERAALTEVRRHLKDKPHRVRNSEEIWWALRSWQRWIDGCAQGLSQRATQVLKDRSHEQAYSLAKRLQASYAALGDTPNASALRRELTAAQALVVEAKAQKKTLPSGQHLVKPALAKLQQRIGVSQRAVACLTPAQG